MAYVPAREIVRMEDEYGHPRTFYVQWEITEPEFDMIRRSQKRGRAHDVTLFIENEDRKLVLIRKHMHPPGAFRAPSGGVEPEEPLDDGARREAWEETGFEVTLDRYLARFLVTFTSRGRKLEWRSDVFTARVAGGTLGTNDPREIAEVGLFTWDELQGPIRARMYGTGTRLLQYRVFLTDRVVELMRARGLSPVGG